MTSFSRVALDLSLFSKDQSNPPFPPSSPSCPGVTFLQDQKEILLPLPFALSDKGQMLLCNTRVSPVAAERSRGCDLQQDFTPQKLELDETVFWEGTVQNGP